APASRRHGKEDGEDEGGGGGPGRALNERPDCSTPDAKALVRPSAAQPSTRKSAPSYGTRGRDSTRAVAEPPSHATATSAGGSTARPTYARATVPATLVSRPTFFSPERSDAPAGAGSDRRTPRSLRGTLPPRESMRAT